MKSIEKNISPESDYYIYTPSKFAEDMFFCPLQCGHFFYNAGYSLCRDSYDSFLLMYIKKGRLLLETEGKNFSIDAGYFALIDCYQRHAYHTDTKCECLWCHFDGIVVRSWYTNIVARLGCVFSIPDHYPALNKLTAIYETFSLGKRVQEPLLSKYLTDILTMFLLHTPQADAYHSHVTMAEEAVSYINEHFTESITIEKLADHVGLSQYHFIRIFKKEIGFTPHEYIINTRIATAKYLLKNTQMSIKDICFSSGFSSESVFCSSFKRQTGMTPLQYRLLEN